MRKQYEGQGIGFLALSLEPDEALVVDAAHALNLEMKIAIARSEALAPLGVNQVPSTVFVRKDGILNAVGSGPKELAWLERRVRELVPAP